MNKTMVLVFASALLLSCQSRKGLYQNQAVGYAQGTTYQITYLTPEKEDWQTRIDSVFAAIDASMSTYSQNSLISRLNRGEGPLEVDRDFTKVLKRSLRIAEATEGYFDPTVGPLVRFWGFGPEGPMPVDTTQLEEIRQTVGFQKVKMQNGRVELPLGSELDFNAIAQGYTVDVIAAFLESQGVENYMVEVGGEVRARGHNTRGKTWRIGVDKPSEELDESDRFQFIVALKDKALATSGNYRKHWEDEETGMKYTHSIDPHSGYPSRNRLLSVSLIGNNATDADAYATACMVMGLEKAQKLVQQDSALEAYFIYTDRTGEWKTWFTPGFEDYLLR